MESSISGRFNNLLAVHLDVSKLITEGTNVSDVKYNPNKKMKFCTEETSSDNVIGKLIGKDVSKVLNSGFYLSGYNSVEELLDSQLNSVIELHKNGHCYEREMMKVVEVIEASLCEKHFNIQDVTKTVLKNIVSLPLNFLWRLTKLEVLNLDQVIHRFGCSRNGTERLLNDIYKLIFKLIEDINAEEILKDIFITLIKIFYDLKDVEGKFYATKNISKNVLNGIIERILKRLDEGKEKLEKSITDEKFVNVYDFLSEYSNLYNSSLEQFASQQLMHILSFEPKLSLNLAIQKQSQWRSTKFNKILSSIFLAIAKLIGCRGSFSTLDMVVRTMEVNWSHIFSFLGTLLLAFPEAPTRLKDEVDQYMQTGCVDQETEFLILGFLYARLASFEGRHVFPAYPQWFASTFGAEATSPANNKQSFLFLVKFLTSLVPYDSPEILKAQISQSIYIPKGCQLDYREYQKIAKCRLDDLKENVTSNAQSKNIENEKAISEVEAAILQYEETRKVPSFILEASIFQRNYYLTHFVPVLLKPRSLPDTPDSRMSLIGELHNLGKIPNKAYQNYKTQSKAFVNLHSNSSKIEKKEHPCREALETYLSEFLSLARSEEEDKRDDDDHKCMSILSKLAELMEEATKDLNSDLKDKMSSGVVITTLDFGSDPVNFQITYRILEAIESLLSSEEKKYTFRRRIGQLLVLLASTASLQVALILTILQRIRLFQEERKYSEREVELLGILYGEILNHSEMFLYMKLSPLPDVKDSTIEDLLSVTRGFILDYSKSAVRKSRKSPKCDQ
ncbi:Fanconi anemia group A protein-like [Armadillidium vulgare]|nr:Fanconi anemia group A protein-like [Armadillidium vulgare]